MPVSAEIKPLANYDILAEAAQIVEQVEKPMSLDYGAFIQVLQKSGNTISYVSYALPREISRAMLANMVTGVLYEDLEDRQEINPIPIADGDLPVLARPGIHLNTIDRLVSVPRMILQTDHPDQESRSMTKYYATQEKIRQELPQIKKHHIDAVFRHKPDMKVADGGHIYHGEYTFTPEGDVVGLNLEGSKTFSLLQLARDTDTRVQMETVVAIFRNYENVTVVLADKTNNVIDCAEGCSKYFEMKEKQIKEKGYFDPAQAMLEENQQKLNPYQRDLVAPGLLGRAAQELLCGACGKATCVCLKPGVEKQKEISKKKVGQ